MHRDGRGEDRLVPEARCRDSLPDPTHGAGESDVCTGPRIGRYRGDADDAVASSARSNRTACRAPSPPWGNTGAAPPPVSRLTHDSGIGLSLIPTGAPYPLTGRFFLTQRRPNRVHVQRIDRRAAGHEQPIALRAAEAEIGNDFRRMEERHLFAVWCMDAHAVGLDAAPAPAAPDVAVGIAADAVREPRPEVGELLAAAHAG